MPLCPTEILDIILGNVDDANGHYACLPINKHAFHHAATMLYTNPLQTFHNLDSSRKRRFLCWLLSISPTDDDFTNELRGHLGIEYHPFRKHATTTTTTATTNASSLPSPLIDYLTFVCVFRWHDNKDRECFFTLFPEMRSHALELGIEQSIYHAKVRMALMWGICGYQLDKMVEIEVEARLLEHSDLFAAVPHLSRLQRLIVHANPGELELFYQAATQFVRVFQEHHGKQQLQECFFTRNPLEDDRRVFQAALELYSLLPGRNEQHQWATEGVSSSALTSSTPSTPSTPSPITSSTSASLSGRDGQAKMLDADFARLDKIVLGEYSRHPWSALAQVYKDCWSTDELARKCRHVTDISATFGIQGYWSEEEQQQARLNQQLARAVVESVPAQTLSLYLTLREQEEDYSIANNALRTSAETVQSLTLAVSFPHPLQDAGDPFTAPPLPEAGVTVQPAPLDLPEAMPHLQQVTLHHSGNMDIDPSFLERSPIRYLEISLNSAHTEQPQRAARWAVLHLPHLTYLVLASGIFDHLDPTSFNHMPSLKILILRTIDYPATNPAATTEENDWTWRWHLPNLRELSISSSAGHSSFNFCLLETCPRLADINLEFAAPPTHLWNSPLLVSLSAFGQHQSQCQFPSVKRLRLGSQWADDHVDANVRGLSDLLQTLTGLERLDVKVLRGYRAGVLEATRAHPALREVVVDVDPFYMGDAEGTDADEPSLDALGLVLLSDKADALVKHGDKLEDFSPEHDDGCLYYMDSKFYGFYS
ncbi:hypothetical protein BKA57DRAFT_448368 [Linnemannia elongata]|nr:hypothetical protein BKA57DRAFT_448368 [Linnemannia elongata]